MPKPNILIMTVGLPRCGKTTWALKQGLPIVNPDSIRVALHNFPFVPEAEPMVWVIAKYMVKALFLAGHDRVILDATNTTRDRRDEWTDKFWIKVFKVFDTTPDVCIERAKNTDKPYLVEVIRRMYEVYKSPEWDEIGQPIKEALPEEAE